MRSTKASAHLFDMFSWSEETYRKQNLSRYFTVYIVNCRINAEIYSNSCWTFHSKLQLSVNSNKKPTKKKYKLKQNAWGMCDVALLFSVLTLFYEWFYVLSDCLIACECVIVTKHKTSPVFLRFIHHVWLRTGKRTLYFKNRTE